MPIIKFIERLQQKSPILADGAMGTLLHQRTNLPLNACYDELNLTRPELVYSIHADYIEAGSELIETNTFGANRYKLADFLLGNKVKEINQAAVSIARKAITASSRDNVYIAGAVGPLGEPIRPYGSTPKEQAISAFQEQIQSLIDADIDVLLLESFDNHDELLLALETARSLTNDLPIIAQATFPTAQVTMTGSTPARVANELFQTGANVIGTNCGGGPAHIAEILRGMNRAVPNQPLSVMPNAGFPELISGRRMYAATPDYFGKYAATFQAAGAVIIGGCCGTGPEHIAAMRRALDSPARASIIEMPTTEISEEIPVKTPVLPTRLAQRLADGKFTITVEITPPRSFHVEKVVTSARLLRDAGAHLLNVADTPAAKMKMSAWAVAHLLQTEVGIETVLHFPTRGRNLLRVQGDLLAAHALDLRSIFITMGDPARIGDYPTATDHFDIAPSKLIALIKHNMNHGCDLAGNSIGEPTSFTVGCALNMAADNIDQEIRVLHKKMAAGADFVLGQAIFDFQKIEGFYDHYLRSEGSEMPLPVIMGIIPLYSLSHAQFLHNEVPGISIPDSIFKRLEDAGDNASQEGIKIAQELLRQIRHIVQGAYIISPYSRYNLAAEVINY